MIDYVNATDDVLLSRATVGDEEAANEIYRRNYISVYGFLFRASKSVETAQDVTQNTFATFFLKVRKEKLTITSLRPYLCTIAKYEFFRYRRDNFKARENEKELTDITSNLDTELEKKEFEQHVKNAIGELPDEERLVILLWVYEEMLDNEIGTVLEIPTNTVKTKKRKAKEILKTKLSNILQLFSRKY